VPLSRARTRCLHTSNSPIRVGSRSNPVWALARYKLELPQSPAPGVFAYLQGNCRVRLHAQACRAEPPEDGPCTPRCTPRRRGSAGTSEVSDRRMDGSGELGSASAGAALGDGKKTAGRIRGVHLASNVRSLVLLPNHTEASAPRQRLRCFPSALRPPRTPVSVARKSTPVGAMSSL
jgi:hypothetical protein